MNPNPWIQSLVYQKYKEQRNMRSDTWEHNYQNPETTEQITQFFSDQKLQEEQRWGI
jgi:hypothetical protein